jgi:peroxidase
MGSQSSRPYSARNRRERAQRHARRLKKRPHLNIEPLEPRCTPTVTGFRPIDDVGNNVNHPTWGTAGIDLLRASPVAYADGISAPSLPGNASARFVSNEINNQTVPIFSAASNDVSTSDANQLTDFGYVFGQFMDHDLDLTPDGGASFPISVPATFNGTTDPIGQAGPLPFSRSQFDPNTGTSTSNPRQQINAVSGFLDLSQVYGSTLAVDNALRTFSNGMLKSSPGGMLPYNNTTYFTTDQLTLLNMANDSQAVRSDQLFAAGDRRANENIELTAMQTLFLRNHNRLAAIFKANNPTWTDQQIFLEARKINIADYQYTIYNQYLPDLIGNYAPGAYQGYNSSFNPGIATEFSTVGFRFGHSMLDNGIGRHDNNGNDIAGGEISLALDFFDPFALSPTGSGVGPADPITGLNATDIGPVLKSDADGTAQATDVMAVTDIRNLLFGNGAFGGQDLMARDVQRARDHGIGTYNQLRVAYGLPAVTSFSQITRNVTVQNELKAAYGSVNNIDPFEGGLAEDHNGGSDMGPLFSNILFDQFERTRDGDRYYWLNQSYNSLENSLLNQGLGLAQLIALNSTASNLQQDVFKFTSSIEGTLWFGSRNSGYVVVNAAVYLEDTSGTILATTTSDGNGSYFFNSLSSATGGITTTGPFVIVVPSQGGFVTTSTPGTRTITFGDQDVDGADFVLNFGPSSAASAASSTNSAAMVMAMLGHKKDNAADSLFTNNR